MINHATQKNSHPNDYFYSADSLNAFLQELSIASERFKADHVRDLRPRSDVQLLRSLNEFVVIQDSATAVFHYADVLEGHDPAQNQGAAHQIREWATLAVRPISGFMTALEALEPARLQILITKEDFKDFHPVLKRILMPVFRSQPYFAPSVANAIIEKCEIGQATDGPYEAKLRDILYDNILYSKAFGYETPGGHSLAKEFVSEHEIKALKEALHDRKADFGRFTGTLFQLARSGINPQADYVAQGTIPWAPAEKLIVQAYQEFSPELGAISRATIADGSFHLMPPSMDAHVTVQTSRALSPEIFLSFSGSWSDVREAAHELGHLTQATKRNENTHWQAVQSVFVDETAALFGEKIFWEAAKRKAGDVGARLMESCDQVTTLLRFAAIDDFQNAAAALCTNGQFNAASLRRSWSDINESYLGIPEQMSGQSDWRLEPHVLQKPFTAIAYAYGQLMADRIWKAYEAEPTKFPEQYTTFLSKTSGAPGRELFSGLGLDTERSDFWAAAVDSILGDFDKAVRSATRASGYSRQDMARLTFGG